MTTSVKNYFDSTCKNLLLCRKNIQLYPAEHPRVASTMAAIRENLTLYQRSRGRPFTIFNGATQQTPQEATDDSSAVQEVYPELNKILKFNLIEKLTIYAEVESEDLLTLCRLLRDDISKNKSLDTEREDPLLTLARRSEKLRITFYKAVELPEELSRSHDVLRMKAGLHKSKQLEPVFNALAPEVRESVQSALKNSAFLEKVSDLRKSLVKHLPSSETDDDRQIDLVAEIIQSFLPDPDKVGESPLTGDEILLSIKNVVEFMQENIQSLTGSIQSYPGSSPLDTFRTQFREAIQTGSRLSGQVGRVQLEKERLTFLFRTARNASSDPADAPKAVKSEDDRAEIPKNAPPVKKKTDSEKKKNQSAPAAKAIDERDRSDSDETLEDRMAAITVDRDGFRQEIAEINPRAIALHVSLDLIKRRERLDPSALKSIIENILKSCEDAKFFDFALAEASRFASELHAPESKRLLFSLLNRLENPTDYRRAFEEIVLERGDGEVVNACIEDLMRKDFEKAAAILPCLRKSEREDIRQLAEDALLSRSGNPRVLVNWLREDPKTVLQPENFATVLVRLSKEHLDKVFRQYFSTVGFSDALALIRDLPPKLPGGERILYTAMDHGNNLIRKAAIAHLYKYPGPVTLGTLKGLVTHNNQKATPAMDDVESALKSLTRMIEARDFVREVIKKKQTFSYAYRKEIRRLAAKLAKERKFL